MKIKSIRINLTRKYSQLISRPEMNYLLPVGCRSNCKQMHGDTSEEAQRTVNMANQLLIRSRIETRLYCLMVSVSIIL